MTETFNINNKATVILTKVGADILNKFKYTTKTYVEGEKFSCELWYMMATFGPNLYAGSNIPFKNNIIEIEHEQC